ncbi:MAG: ATP-dependent zinc protease [Oligoflexus sp.]
MYFTRLRVILLLFLVGTGCSTSKSNEVAVEAEPLVKKASSKLGEDKTNEEIESEQPNQLRAEIDRFKESLREEIREVIREEILPELWTSSVYSTEVASGQKKLRKGAKAKTFLGRVEWVKFKEPDFELQARIDTGAKTSSLHAINIREQQVNGELFVQFEALDQDDKRHTLVRRVVTKTNVKNASGETSRRYVIRERINLGGRIHDINVNLNDRNDLRYRFLIGRNLLIGNYLVDVSKSHLLGDRL